MTFEDLGLSLALLKAIGDCGYTTPTPIQEKAIPLILMSRDVVGLAQTGTGKTAGFTLPMIEILQGGRAKARMPRSLILTPTRELAAQIAENFDTYGKYTKLTKALLTGGVSMDEQVKKLERGVDVLIATPGRLMDLFDRGKILLTDIKILVIDEADRMLDMGFIPDIEKIISLLPVIRQTLLFSATMPPEIRKLTTRFLSNPKEVSVTPQTSAAKTVSQFLVWTETRRKQEVLKTLIEKEGVHNAFIFCNRKRDIGGLTNWLKRQGYAAEALHGDMPQSQRTMTLRAFDEGQIKLLICSDVAARGLDIEGVSHVFNFDVPINPDDYIHRIGRTGRAGKEGRAWMLATDHEDKQVKAIEKQIGAPLKTENSQKTKTEIKPATSDSPPQKSARSQPARQEEGRRPRPPERRPAQPSRPPEKRPPVRREIEDAESTGFGMEIPDFFSKK